MSKLIANTVFALIVLQSVLADPCNKRIKGYYWRDYYGDIPEDALPAGLDVNGKQVYIGQALHDALIVPGTIYSKNKGVHFEFYGPKISLRNNKILCTRDPDGFIWIPTRDSEVYLHSEHAISAGYEESHLNVNILVARTFVDGGMTVGKAIIGDNHYYNGLFTVRDDHKYLVKNFELLNYDPDIEVQQSDNGNVSNKEAK